MQAATLRRWGWVHKWSSLVCTLFILMLCLTGLPLVFSHEIEHLAGDEIEAPAMPEGAPRAPVDQVAAQAVAAYPGLVPLYFFAEEDEPDLWYVKLDTRVDTDESESTLILSDARTGGVLGAPNFDEGFMSVMYRLHVDLYAGLPGKLFLGLMGLLLMIAIISGVVLYAPFMRKLRFGEVRQERAARTRWLDLHNLLGIVTLVWALAVGFTGVINTWADLIFKGWQAEQVAALQAGETRVLLAAEAEGAPAVDGTLQASVDRALAAAPGMAVSMIAYPGTLRATPEHIAVILRGDTPLTSRLTQALLVDPATGDVLEASARPWYVTALQLSEPLHFGDYGGLPLKVLWGLLDILTIIVLGSGLYLWLKRGVTERQP
ncbi:PepSY-associated TM helix domain-containing protein [Stutzerimonas chloritidismutans]|uniref:PepSY-associated TM helix domain-containing protein n=1 Tax=Stutzerimonas chloritidismutans TaxID=203192 RepID=UPI003F164B65